VKRRVSSPEIHMKKTTAKFVSAIFASILASSTLTAAPNDEEKAADRCLLGPSASTPPGGHWYYRVDRVNKRNCWYVVQGKERAARKPADESSARTEQAAAPSPQTPVTQRSISDARAELPPPPTPLEQDATVAATQRIADNNQRAGTSDANLLSSAVASRWPDPLVAAPAATAPPAPVTASPPAPAIRVAERQPQVAPAAPPPRPAVVPAPPATANSAAGKSSLSLPMLLTVLAGALSVIGVIGSVVFGLLSSSRSTRLSSSAPMPPFEFVVEQPRAPDDPKRRIEKLLGQLNRRDAA
jgi:hypothetical protein